MAVYGNVNVKYAPCKSAAQLHSAADYIMGFSLLSEMEFFAVPKNGISLNI